MMEGLYRNQEIKELNSHGLMVGDIVMVNGMRCTVVDMDFKHGDIPNSEPDVHRHIVVSPDKSYMLVEVTI